MYAADLLQSCRLRKTPTIALKLDFKKAFDSVSWVALDVILQARGFGNCWRSWIRNILATSKTAVLLNGVPSRWIRCKKGLRQGDPLSPYLFLIVADLLHQMIARDASSSRLLHPLVDDLSCPVIQYADDTLPLVPAEQGQLSRLKSILDAFSAATELSINFHKSTFVPVNVDPARATRLAAELGCPLSMFPQTYLGLPLSHMKLPASALDFLPTKIERRIPGWRTRFVDQGGHLTPTSAVLSAIPTHAMSVLPLSKGTMAKMDRPRRAMFWPKWFIKSSVVYVTRGPFGFDAGTWVIDQRPLPPLGKFLPPLSRSIVRLRR